MSSFKKPIFVAEIGATHIGDMDRAEMLIKLAAEAGADYCKFQKRNIEECVKKDILDKPHPNPDFSYGLTYREHREKLELSIEQHQKLFVICNKYNTKYSCSVWDMTSTKEIIKLDPDYIKVPSACNNNYNIINYLYNKYSKKIHISLGMLNNKEKINLFKFIKTFDNQNRFVIYHCTSAYPCSNDKMFLLEINNLKNTFPNIGFSNHGNEKILNDIMAYTLGATWFERHFIDNYSFRHTDTKVSLNPNDFKNLIEQVNESSKALNYKKTIIEEEIEERKKLRSI